MSTLPGTIVGDIEWFEQRVGAWAENPIGIGLTAGKVTEITTETTQARTAYDAAQAAKTAAKNATVTQNTQVSEMRSLGGQLITVIRAFAQTQPDPNAVYTLASVPPKQEPTSVPPVTPTDIDFDLTNNGEISLKWKGSTTGGTVFSISRSVQTEPGQPFGPFEQIGLTGTRAFIDGTIPSCTIAAQYTVRAYKGAFPPAASKITTVRFVPSGNGDTTQLRVAA